MNKKKMLAVLMLIFSVTMASPAVLQAGEHGGHEHGGHEHGSHGSHGMADKAKTLKEAAKALKDAGHEELAAEVKAIAKSLKKH